MSKNHRRMALIGSVLVAASALSMIALGNMGESLVYYWNPTELVDSGDKAVGASIRLGGVVKMGTLDWRPDDNYLAFTVSDMVNDIEVRSTGAPPQMFREGIGVVVEGTMTDAGVFETDRLMVKHSNEYRAPEDGVASEDLYKTVEGL